MSIQHRDLANAAKELNLSNRFDSDKLTLISQLATLIEDLAPPSRNEHDLAADQREEQIRKLRMEFGFAPDDAPVAHLHPLASGLAS